MKILVVDDEADILNYLTYYLQKSGFEAVGAASGEAALRMCEDGEYSPNLLIADLVLPGISGFEVASRLREARPSLRTLFISGYTGAEYLRQKGVAVTDVPFLQKPFTPDVLVQKIQELMKIQATKSTRHQPASANLGNPESSGG